MTGVENSRNDGTNAYLGFHNSLKKYYDFQQHFLVQVNPSLKLSTLGHLRELWCLDQVCLSRTLNLPKCAMLSYAII